MRDFEKFKKKFYKNWWAWVIVIIVIGVIGSGVNRSSSGTKVGEKDSAVETSTEETKKNEPTTFKIGDIIQLKDYKVVVNGIRTTQGTEFIKPAEGKEFLYIDCTMENTSDKQQVVSSVMMFKVIDGDGRSLDQAIVTDANGQLDGTVDAGRKISGEYVVQVPVGKTGIELEFDSSLWSSEKMIVTLR